MSNQPLLSESTQKRILLLAGMSHFSDEVIAESKNGVPCEPDYTGGEKSLKPATKSGKKEEPADKKKLNEEIPVDNNMDAAPVAPVAPSASNSPVDPATDPNTPANSASVDLKGFAKYLADYFKSQGHEITFTVDGEDVAQEDIAATEDEFSHTEPDGDEFGAEESEPTESTLDDQPVDPNEKKEPTFESKEKQVAKLVYEEVIKSLTSNLNKNKGKVQVKLASKAKK